MRDAYRAGGHGRHEGGGAGQAGRQEGDALHTCRVESCVDGWMGGWMDGLNQWGEPARRGWFGIDPKGSELAPAGSSRKQDRSGSICVVVCSL